MKIRLAPRGVNATTALLHEYRLQYDVKKRTVAGVVHVRFTTDIERTMQSIRFKQWAENKVPLDFWLDSPKTVLTGEVTATGVGAFCSFADDGVQQVGLIVPFTGTLDGAMVRPGKRWQYLLHHSRLPSL